MNYKKIQDFAKSNLPYMVKIRRHLHQNAQIGFECHGTMEYIKEKLSELSVKSQYVGKCGLCATIGNGEPCVLLRADADALEICEKTGLGYAAKNGNMHACGHDMHTAMLLGAAKILCENEKSLHGSVKLMFQSAEEILEGASDMIKHGILENPKPIAAIMLHVMTATEIKTGTLTIPTIGESAPAADFFKITVNGKGCHGSSPFLGKDPIYASSAIITALSEINSRELAMSDRAVISICSIDGKSSANVIPESVVMSGTLRCFGEENREYIKKRLCEISKNTAKVFRTEAEVEFFGGCPSLINNEGLCSLMSEKLCLCLGKEYVIDASKARGDAYKTSGSEDFANISHAVPSLMLALAAGEKKDGYTYPLHHPCTSFDESAMVNGCAALVLFALEAIENK